MRDRGLESLVHHRLAIYLLNTGCVIDMDRSILISWALSSRPMGWVFLPPGHTAHAHYCTIQSNTNCIPCLVDVLICRCYSVPTVYHRGLKKQNQQAIRKGVCRSNVLTDFAVVTLQHGLPPILYSNMLMACTFKLGRHGDRRPIEI